MSLVLVTSATVLATAGAQPASAVGCGPLITVSPQYQTPFGVPLKVNAPGLLAGVTGTAPILVETSWQIIEADFPSDDFSLWGNADIRYGTPGGSLNRNGGFTYTPDPDPLSAFSGEDTFDFTVIDACGNEDFQTAGVTVVPIVVDSTYAAVANTPLSVPAATGFLANDKGVDPASLFFDVVSAQGGAVDDSNASDGSFVYTPPAGFTGNDSFGYSVDDLNGDHTYLGTVHIYAAPVGAPDPPTNVVAVPGDKSALVLWTAANNHGHAITSSTVTATPGGATRTVLGAGTSASFPGLTNGTAYTFTVSSTNSIGAGAPSAPSAAVKPGAPPSAPTGVHATFSGGLIRVSWTAPANNGSPISSYVVTAAPGGKTSTVAGSKTNTAFSLPSGTYRFRVRATNTFGTGPFSGSSNAISVAVVQSTHKSGYWMLSSAGHVYGFGNAMNLGSGTGPAVAIASRRDGNGYWTVDARGVVTDFGFFNVQYGRPSLRAGESISTISATPSGQGYWLFSNRGRAFPYGDAHFYGDMGAVALNGPVIASVATPTGHGYYIVGSDGGVFSFGDARFHGSTGGFHLNKPIVGIAPTSNNSGYWLVASDGGVFAFDAPFRGSMGAAKLSKPVNGLVAYGNGYLMVASDGGVFDFSNKAFLGSLASNPPGSPIIGIAAFAT